jgi:hypothetical protein
MKAIVNHLTPVALITVAGLGGLPQPWYRYGAAPIGAPPAVGSLETRVFVTARHFADVADLDEQIPAPRPVEEAPRPLTAAELLEAVAEERPELPDPGPQPHGVASLRQRRADLP